jgi:hypothetical protein
MGNGQNNAQPMQLDLDQNDGMNNLFRAMEADEIQVLA